MKTIRQSQILVGTKVRFESGWWNVVGIVFGNNKPCYVYLSRGGKEHRVSFDDVLERTLEIDIQ